MLGGQPAIAGVAAGLRALAGDPGDDVAAGLITAAQAARLTALAGRGADGRAVLERAWVLESRLRKLAPAGTVPVPLPLPRSKLRVIALDQRVGTVSSRVLGTYLTAALAHLLRGDPARAALAAHAVRARRGQAARRHPRPAQRRVRAVGDRARAGLPGHPRARPVAAGPG